MHVDSSAVQKPPHVTLCVGREWYRYLSSFFLPNASYVLQHCSILCSSFFFLLLSRFFYILFLYLCLYRSHPRARHISSPRWHLAFIKSGFTGQLPKLYESPAPIGTRLIPSHMNHLNQEEPTRYVCLSSILSPSFLCFQICIRFLMGFTSLHSFPICVS